MSDTELLLSRPRLKAMAPIQRRPVRPRPILPVSVRNYHRLATVLASPVRARVTTRLKRTVSNRCSSTAVTRCTRTTRSRRTLGQEAIRCTNNVNAPPMCTRISQLILTLPIDPDGSNYPQ